MLGSDYKVPFLVCGNKVTLSMVNKVNQAFVDLTAVSIIVTVSEVPMQLYLSADADLHSAARQMHGDSMQLPPMFSAIKACHFFFHPPVL